jgi:predicted Rossmann fold nucleotide-binding protein DprA/Smf involved in DNA uptake
MTSQISVTAAPSPETIATLLLCGRFGETLDGPRLLSPSEYHGLAQWLDSRRLAFGDLIKPGARSILESYVGHGQGGGRLPALLNRTDELRRALEKWSQKGIWVIARTDPNYPRRLHQRLKRAALPLLFGASSRSLLDGGGVCIVGSRDSPQAALEFARAIGSRCAREGMTVVSSDMRGVDREAVNAALDAGGKGICVLSGALEKAITAKRYRAPLAAGALAMVTPFSPDTRFKAANAIRVNKYQYALSDVAVVVETREKGGVWLGAEENRHKGWVPAFIRSADTMSSSNRAALHLGLLPITLQDVERSESLRDFFIVHGLSTWSERSGTQSPCAPSARPGAPLDLYSLFVAELRTIVAAAPRAETEIVEHFKIERTQARSWLARALADGIVRKTDDAKHYMMP